MLTPAKLFWIRLKQHYVYIGKSLRTTTDWTVWLYIIVPALFIFSGLYIELWTKLPNWSYSLRWDFILIAMFSFIFSAQVHIGVDEADRLVLLQHRSWMIRLKRYGYMYSALIMVIRLLLVFLLLLPFLLGTSAIQQTDMLLLLLYSAVAGFLLLTLNHYFVQAGKWRRKLVRALQRSMLLGAVYVFPVYGYIALFWGQTYMLAVFAALLILTLLMLYRYMTTPFHYPQQLQEEQSKRAGFTGILLSQVEEKRASKRLKRPWVFRSSQRLFKSSHAAAVITELRVKALLRSLPLLQVWLLMLAAGSYAIILVGGSGGWVVVAGLLILKRTWLKLQWEQWVSSEYLALYVKNQSGAYKLSQHVLTVPDLLVWIIVALICSL